MNRDANRHSPINHLKVSVQFRLLLLSFYKTCFRCTLSAGVSVAPESEIQNVRMVCNEDGRRWRERGERRVIIRDPRDSYGYAPRARYIERRGYEERGGIGLRAPGVSVGIGTDRY
jgi:hypothetical protein